MPPGPNAANDDRPRERPRKIVVRPEQVMQPPETHWPYIRGHPLLSYVLRWMLFSTMLVFGFLLFAGVLLSLGEAL
jgi:hypothetical protein